MHEYREERVRKAGVLVRMPLHFRLQTDGITSLSLRVHSMPLLRPPHTGSGTLVYAVQTTELSAMRYVQPEIALAAADQKTHTAENEMKHPSIVRRAQKVKNRIFLGTSVDGIIVIFRRK